VSSFRQVQVGEVMLRVALQGEGPLVALVHGFPESWYSWRHQLGPIAAAGFTACAIDVRGYGGSDKPHEVEAYSLEHLSRDLAGLIAALSPDKPAVVIGHDWGAPIAWTTVLVHPGRVRAVAGLSVPYTGTPQQSLREVVDAVYTSQDRFSHLHSFEAQGVAEVEFEADVRRGGCDASFTPGAATRRPRRGPRTSGHATQSCCASPIRISCRLGSPTLISTTMSASLSGPAFAGRSIATAITIGTSPSYGTSREAASNSRRSTSAASGTGFSRCSETACPSCEAHCRTYGGFTCFQAAATGLSRSGLKR
jgi:pimeloyl-ACP methyl ester carboxylesterase